MFLLFHLKFHDQVIFYSVKYHCILNGLAVLFFFTFPVFIFVLFVDSQTGKWMNVVIHVLDMVDLLWRSTLALDLFSSWYIPAIIVHYISNSWNVIQGAGKIAEALKENRTITRLDLVWTECFFVFILIETVNYQKQY